jgi:hypothetical protein
MGPWASAIVAVAAFLAFVVAVFGFRGFMETVEGTGNRCGSCGRDSWLPLPVARHECWRCRHGEASRSAELRSLAHR